MTGRNEMEGSCGCAGVREQRMVRRNQKGQGRDWAGREMMSREKE